MACTDLKRVELVARENMRGIGDAGICVPLQRKVERVSSSLDEKVVIEELKRIVCARRTGAQLLLNNSVERDILGIHTIVVMDYPNIMSVVDIRYVVG